MKESGQEWKREHESRRFSIRQEECGTVGQTKREKENCRMGIKIKTLNVKINHNIQRNTTVYY